ncbi:MAG: polysaccharide biosynthesis tyrosine autokinase [Parasphingorhabdus sp.]|nr:polysaccharide biosynthesis tyrosine autokinase [Parasphingorhabdus sp.]
MNDGMSPKWERGDQPSDTGDTFDSPGGLQQNGLDIRAILRSIKRCRYEIIAIIVFCLIAGVLISVLSTPKYFAKSTIQIDQEAAKVLGTEDSDAAASVKDSSRFLQTQAGILRGRSITIAVAEDLKLFNNQKFMDDSRKTFPDSAEGSLSLQETRREQVIDFLQDNLSVSLPIDTTILTIGFLHPDAEWAADIANSYSQNFIRSNLERKFDTTAYARGYLKEQLALAQANLSAAERAAVEYARQAGIIETGASDRENGTTSLTTSSLVDLNRAYSAAASRRIAAEAKWNNFRSRPERSQTQVLNNLAVQRLLEEQAKLEATYQAELERRKAQFPTVRQTKAQIDELQSQINQITQNIRSSVENEYRTALAEERKLANQIEVLKSQTLDQQSKSVRLTILQREAETKRRLYDILLQRFNEVNAESGIQTNNVTIVDEASTPIRPETPNIPLNMTLALFAGLFLSTAFVFVRENFLDTIQSVEDVRNLLGESVIGVIPEFSKDSDIGLEMAAASSIVSEAFNSVRTSLTLSSRDGSLPKTILFTSAVPSEGKSSSCAGTAIALSKLGKKVVIMDLDLRRPNVHSLLGIENSVGSADLLASKIGIEEAIRPSGYEGISAITTGHIPPDPSALLSSYVLNKVLKELMNRFDVVLIDAPPTIGLADAPLIAATAESCIFVVKHSSTNISAIKHGLERLKAAKASIVGVLLTNHTLDTSSYYGNYNYTYK